MNCDHNMQIFRTCFRYFCKFSHTVDIRLVHFSCDTILVQWTTEFDFAFVGGSLSIKSLTVLAVIGVMMGDKGEQLPVRRISMGTAKRHNNITSTFQQHICFRKTSGWSMGTPNLFLARGAI